MLNIFELFKKKKVEEYHFQERQINPMYIISDSNREEYIKFGYTILKNIVSDENINKVEQVFKEISNLPGYFESDKLQTTIAFGEEAHTMAINVVNEVSTEIFKNVLDDNLCRFDFGGGIIIKNKGCWFAPHQDCSIIDEYKGTTSYAWIPTVDMTNDNGTFFAIPGSHLWAAWQRSSQYPSWPLKEFSKLLWDKMAPIFVDKGDVLLFDSALIHASGENFTDNIRIAFNMCIIEKNAEHVQYFNDKKENSASIEKYIVDEEYWYKGNLWGKPKGYKKIVEQKKYPINITEAFVLKNLEKYQQNDKKSYR